MTWVILAGQNRSGKTTAAEFYKRQGYAYVHLDPPKQEYYKEGYTGPSYADEMMALVMQYDGINTVFDRSWYDELIWPKVFHRKPLLTEEDFFMLKEYEDANETIKYTLTDPDSDAHWRRILSDKRLAHINRGVFVTANKLLKQVGADNGFQDVTLENFPLDGLPELEPVEEITPEVNSESKPIVSKRRGQTKLEKANAINAVLNSRIIKKKGNIYDALENDVRDFLNNKLNTLLGEPQQDFSKEELFILKQFCKSLKDKHNKNNGANNG